MPVSEKLNRQSRRHAALLNTLVWLPLLFVLSCAHTQYYSEPSLPDSDTASLQADVPVWIASVDGKKVSYGLTNDSKMVKVAPGPHRVEVKYFDRRLQISRTMEGRSYVQNRLDYSITPIELRFIAKPGHRYYITAVHDGNHWSASITDFLTLAPSPLIR